MSFNIDNIFEKKKRTISEDTQIIFVADLFVDNYVGGAELTSEAIIQSSPFKIEKLKSSEVTMDLLQKGSKKYWIFGNFAGLNPQLIPSIVANLNYSILEYDYKYCKYRSPEKHQKTTGLACDCHNQMNGKLISAFYYGSDCLWWMSEGQKEKYTTLFPFLLEKSNIVLSSVFDKKTLGLLKLLRESAAASQEKRKGWLILGSDSWIKGFESAKKWCEDNNKEYEVVWNVPYDQVLAKMSTCEGFVYLPEGRDTCPRMVIEAKLLGCKLQLNDNVQHKNEEWFNTEDLNSIEEYLYAATDLFWNAIRSLINYSPRISGYTTTRNCIEQNYPWEESIQSLLGFCQEVCVVDGGSTDGTWERLIDMVMEPKGIKLSDLSEEDRKITLEMSKTGAVGERPDGKKIRIMQVARDWNHPRFAVFDGLQKAEARNMCTGDFCWQMDVDEVVHENDYQKIKDLAKKFPKGVDLIALPVVEYWGSTGKVRVDVNPWKWRLSRNNKNITHGIPLQHRRQDNQGQLYSAGSDGCDYIFSDSYEPVPFVTFYAKDADDVRRNSMNGDNLATLEYEKWLNAVIQNLPGVHHYSWFDIERKIHTYKNYWSKHWTSLFNQVQEDTPENNKFFGKKWSDITDTDIKNLSIKLESELGGWIFHSLVDFSKPTPFISVNSGNPEIMSNWIQRFKGKNS